MAAIGCSLPSCGGPETAEPGAGDAINCVTGSNPAALMPSRKAKSNLEVRGIEFAFTLHLGLADLEPVRLKLLLLVVG